MIQEILDRFDKEFPILWKTNPPWSSKSPASYVTCEQEIKNFIRTEITAILESLKREDRDVTTLSSFREGFSCGFNIRNGMVTEDI